MSAFGLRLGANMVAEMKEKKKNKKKENKTKTLKMKLRCGESISSKNGVVFLLIFTNGF